MTDEPLAELFADGTAPERDAAFAHRVDARISRARLGLRLLKFSIPLLAILTLAAAVYVTVDAFGPELAQLADQSPQFMGVPVPLILVMLAAVFAVRARGLVRFRQFWLGR